MKSDQYLNHRTYFAAAVVAGILMTLLFSFKYTLLVKKLDLFIYDTLMHRVPGKHESTPKEPFVILTIDKKTDLAFSEPSLLWHKYYAQVIDKLVQAEVKAIAFDMIFSSAFSSGLHKEFHETGGIFTTAVKNAIAKDVPVLSGYSLNDKKLDAVPQIYQQAFGRKNIGFLNHSSENDLDGKIRRFSVCYGLECSMMFKLLHSTLARDVEKNISLYENPNIYIDYRIQDTPPLYSLCDIYQEPLGPDLKKALKDKFVLIGYTLPDSKDFVSIPIKVEFQGGLTQKLPGVIINYYIGKTLLAGSSFSEFAFFRSTAEKLGVGILISFLIPMAVFQRFKPVNSKFVLSFFACILSGLVILFFMVVLALFYNFKVMNIGYFILPLVISVSFSIIFRIILYRREKKIILKEFGSFLSPQIVQQLMYDREKRKAFEKGIQKEITIMFVDIRNSTAICNMYENDNASGKEGRHSFVKDLNDYMVAMTRIIDHHHGFLNRIIGDGLLVLFGAFEREQEQADDCIRCGMDMLQEVEKINTEKGFLTQFKPGEKIDGRIQIGVGVNTGQTMMTCSGGELKKEFTVIGSAVNKAARIETLTKGICNTAQKGSNTPEVYALVVGSSTEAILSETLKQTLLLQDFGHQKLDGFTNLQQVFVSKKYKREDGL